MRIRIIVLMSTILSVCLSANSFQDTSGQFNLFTDIKGNAKIDSLNIYASRLKGTNVELRKLLGRKSYRLALKNNYNYGLVKSLINIGASFYYLNEFDSTLYYYRNALPYANTLELKEKLADDIEYVGRKYWTLGKFEASIRVHKEALEIRKQIGNSRFIFHSYNAIGAVYYNAGDYKLALEYYIKASKIENKTKEFNTPLLINNIGLAYLELQDESLALEYFKKALEMSITEKLELGIGYSHLNLGDLNFRQKKYSEALENYSLAKKIYTQLGDENGTAKILNRIGKIHLETNDLKLAESNFIAALNKSKANGLKLTETKSLTNLSRINILRGKYSIAQNHLKLALEISTVYALHKSRLEILELYSIVYEKLKRINTALKYNRLYIALQDSLYKENKLHLVFNAKERYETEEKEKANLALKYTNELQNIELRNKKRELVYIVVLSIFSLFVIAYLIYLNLNRKRQYEELIEANNEVEQINKKLNETNELLNQSNSTKDKFFSIISHDLKNPFGTLLGATQILKVDNGEMSEEEKIELIDIIASDSEKLYALLENLLYWANSQTGKLKANKTRICIYDLITEIVELLQSNARRKNINLKINVPKELEVVFDKFMFSTIIRNLLSNAIKFSLQGGTISINATTLSGKVSIQIKDEGIGINEINITKLFDESSDFKQLGTSDEAGTGLGLILCRDFAHQNNAEIKVKSEVGNGTTFELIV